MFKKDNFIYGCILGMLAPIVGLLLLKYYKFGMLSFKEVLQFIYYQPGHGLMTAGLSVALMMNALFFTIYVNGKKDQTGKGLFVSTVVYGVVILLIKYLS
ncbi:hypothetical protein ACFOWM_12145 [Ferruginibacter yonginensis]|uniref:Uncharacterized protein n=1 Tax=Ferruginibacter yonginensis TaxID=1310416 RepID=A0ABV8QUU4_9BACT